MISRKSVFYVIVLMSCCNLAISSDLLEAIYKNDIARAKVVISSGVDINGEKGKDSPLMATADNCRVDIFDLLIDSGAKISHPYPLLSQAVGRDCAEIYFKLANIKFVESQKKKDHLLLNAAGVSYEGYISVVEDIIKRGANPIVIVPGTVFPQNPINAAYLAKRNTYSRGAQDVYDFLIKVAIKRTGKSEREIYRKYVEMFVFDVENCEAC